jgi:molecular chaperone HscB
VSTGGYFEFFGLPERLGLDSGELQKRFYELSRQWHPDRFAAKAPAERKQALDNTAQLNDAFRVLRDPVSRAEYVLERNGLGVATQGANHVPSDLLEEALELNMALEEADTAELGRFAAQYGEMLAGIDAGLAALFAEFDSGEPAALPKIRQALNRRKYIANLTAKIARSLRDPALHS